MKTSIFLIVVILLISTAISNRILSYSYGQTLEKTYSYQKCGISLQYPSNWQSEDYTLDDEAGHIINYIVEFQPNNDEGFNNVVGIELHDISTLQDKSLGGVKDFEEGSLSDEEEAGIVKVEKSETTQLGGYPAQKIVYNELVSGDKKMVIFTVAFDREYEITYDTNSGYYEKYLSTVDKMIQNFTINQPTFEGINC